MKYGVVPPASSPELVSWILVDLNSYFASCEQQEHPELRGKPVAVVPMMDVDSTAVLAASYEAKRKGVKTGTLVGEAKRLCPGIRFVEADHGVYVDYHQKILDAIDRCIPVRTVLSIDEMSCELKGSQREIPNAIALSKRIKRAIQDEAGECLTSSVGIAENPLLAKIASDMEKPDGLVVLHAGNRDALLGPLSVRAIPGIGAKMEARLNREGFFQIRDLLGASRDRMRSLWGGVVGERYHDWLHGGGGTMEEGEAKSISHQHVLEPENRTADGAHGVLKKLLARAAVRLRKNEFYAKRLSVSIRWMRSRGAEGEDEGWDAGVKLEETHDTIALMRALEEMLARMPRDRKPIRVGVTFSGLVPAERHQFSLFEDPRREQLNAFMDRINTKYGKDTVSFASLSEVKAASSSKIAFHRIPTKDEFDSEKEKD